MKTFSKPKEYVLILKRSENVKLLAGGSYFRDGISTLARPVQCWINEGKWEDSYFSDGISTFAYHQLMPAIVSAIASRHPQKLPLPQSKHWNPNALKKCNNLLYLQNMTVTSKNSTAEGRQSAYHWDLVTKEDHEPVTVNHFCSPERRRKYTYNSEFESTSRCCVIFDTCWWGEICIHMERGWCRGWWRRDTVGVPPSHY